MANVIQRKIFLEAQRNVVVGWSGVLDTSNFSTAPALALSECVYNSPGKTLTGFRLLEAQWSVTSPLQIVVSWNATTPQYMAIMSQSGEFEHCDVGGLYPDQGAAGYDGALNVASLGWAAGSIGFTVILELAKLYR